MSKRILLLGLPVILCVTASSKEVAGQTTTTAWTLPQCSIVKGTGLVTFTKDDGRTLAGAEETAPENSYLDSLTALNAPNTLLSSSNGNLLLSIDAGCTWKSLKNNLPRAKGMLAKADGSASVWLEGEPYAGGKREDILLEVGPKGEMRRVAPPLNSIFSIAVNKSDGKHMRSAGEGAIGRGGSLTGKTRFEGAIMDSTDGGRTWTVIGKYPQTKGEPGRAVFSPQNINRVIFFSSFSGASLSTDGGASWKRVAGLPENVNQVVFSPADEKIVWAVGIGKTHYVELYLSQDGGQSFELAISDTARIDTDIMAPHPLDKNVLYFASNRTSLASYDQRTRKTDEQNCQEYCPKKISAILFSPASPSLIYLGLSVPGRIMQKDVIPRQSTDSQASILQAKGETVRIKLLDAATGEAVSNSALEVNSENGIVCVKSPCPTNRKSWKGKTDAGGYVVLPRDVLQSHTGISVPSFSAPSYRSEDLIKKAAPSRDAWILRIVKYPEPETVPTSDTGPYELRCRGNQNAFVFKTANSSPQADGQIIVSYEMAFTPSPQAAGTQGEGLEPGQCSWIDRPVNDQEPYLIKFETPLDNQLKRQQNGNSVDTSPTLAEKYPDARTIPAYLNDPDHYWCFLVYNTNRGYFLATSHKHWKRGSKDEIGRPINSITLNVSVITRMGGLYREVWALTREDSVFSLDYSCSAGRRPCPCENVQGKKVAKSNGDQFVEALVATLIEGSKSGPHLPRTYVEIRYADGSIRKQRIGGSAGTREHLPCDRTTEPK